MEISQVNTILITDSDIPFITKIIDENLVSLCWGKQNSELFSKEEVVAEFLCRIKDGNWKTGYLGEFLFYIYIIYKGSDLYPLGLFLNQEERSFKKGFDLPLYRESEVWYSEVKSANLGINDDLNEVNINKIREAYYDCNAKFREDKRNQNMWLTAKANLIKIVECKTERKAIASILDKDYKNPSIDNVILCSVLFQENDEPLIDEKLISLIDDYKQKYRNITIVSIKKKTMDRIIKIIEGIS